MRIPGDDWPVPIDLIPAPLSLLERFHPDIASDRVLEQSACRRKKKKHFDKAAGSWGRDRRNCDILRQRPEDRPCHGEASERCANGWKTAKPYARCHDETDVPVFWVMATLSQPNSHTERAWPANDGAPTTLADCKPILSHETLRDAGTQADVDPEETGQTIHRDTAGKISTAETRRLPRGEDASVNHATTPPIAVPHPTSNGGLDHLTTMDLKGHQPDQDPSPLECFLQNRRTSITFHPTVTLDTGHQRVLDEPLPKLAINTNTQRKSLLQEARFPSCSPLSRVQSEADTRNYDTLTGEPIDTTSRIQSPVVNFGAQPQLQSHSQATPIPQLENRASPDLDQGVSLTSESTASLPSEVQTPTEAMDLLLSPVSTFPPLAFPISLEDSSAWPKARRQYPGLVPKSYEKERSYSMRSAQRQSSRASTRRSTSSSNMSPATAFLSRFARQELPPEPDSEGQEVGEYVIGKQVGFGGFSSVKEAYTIEGDTRICRAVKIVRKQIPGKAESENEQLQAEFEHEVSLWRCLGHRNILPLIEVYETNFATFCFTKLNTGGTLFDVVRANRRGVERDRARRYAYQLASAVRYLHEDVRIVHRDIKLENCLIDVSDPMAAKDGGNVLLCDFGLAEFITNDDRSESPHGHEQATDRPASPPPSNLSEASQSIAGSLQYASPELILSPAGFLSPVVDVWAFGVVMYALLVGDLPFQHTFQPRVQMMILAGEWNVDALEQAAGVVGYEEEVLDMMRACLCMDSEERWNISQVLGCRWLQGCQEILEELNESFKL